jgi:hypothetical protein
MLGVAQMQEFRFRPDVTEMPRQTRARMRGVRLARALSGGILQVWWPFSTSTRE